MSPGTGINLRRAFVNVTTRATPAQIAAARELLALDDALESLAHFRTYLEPTGHSDFRYPPALHHKLIVSKLEDLEAGRVSKLLILAPPGSAKSTYCSIQFPMWWLARHPSSSVLCASNTMTLAESFNRRRRLVALSTEWQRLSECQLEKEGVDEFITTKQGGIRAAGVGSGIVGYRSHLNILDDPITSQEEALSPAALDKHWEWYLNEYRTRLVVGGPELIVSTRWAKRDIAGRILERVREEKETWEILRLPMLADTEPDPLGRPLGGPLWPEYFTPSHIRGVQQDPYIFLTQFQQTPLDESGAWVDRQNIIYTDAPPPGEPYKVIAVDLALTVGKGDYTVFVVAQLDEDRRLHVVHVDRVRVAPDESVDHLFHLAFTHQPMEVLVDDDNASKVFRVALHERMRNPRRGLPQFPLHLMPLGGKDKETRATAIRAMFMRGDVRILKAHWTADLVKELLEFPSGSHDDQVDALSLIGRRLPVLASPKRQPPPRDPWHGFLLKPATMPDGTRVLATQMGLNQLFGDREKLLKRRRFW